MMEETNNQTQQAKKQTNHNADISKMDTICRQAAIEAMASAIWHYPNECYRNLNEYEFAKGLAELGLKSVPPAQPEIIRCKDCKYAHMTNDGQCKYCDIWFPDEKVYVDGDHYCASAERKSDE